MFDFIFDLFMKKKVNHFPFGFKRIDIFDRDNSLKDKRYYFAGYRTYKKDTIETIDRLIEEDIARKERRARIHAELDQTFKDLEVALKNWSTKRLLENNISI